MRALVFSNGLLAVGNEADEQIPELQVNLYVLWAEHAQAKGVDPAGVVITASNGRRWRIIRTSAGFNVEVV